MKTCHHAMGHTSSVEDYEGLASAGRRFHALFAVANGGNTANPTDMHSAVASP
jgi:hypothetical protein